MKMFGIGIGIGIGIQARVDCDPDSDSDSDADTKFWKLALCFRSCLEWLLTLRGWSLHQHEECGCIVLF